MKKKNLISAVALCAAILVPSLLERSGMTLQGQNVGINATGALPDNSAGLDVDFTNKGLLIPRVSLTGPTDNTTISNPATSLLVYNTASAGGLTPGYYYNAGTPASPNWVRLLNGGTPGTAWLLNGNAGTTAGTHFLGTTDNVDLVFKTNNTEQMRITNTGNVGIGTTTPSELLELQGGGIQLNGTMGIGFNGDTPYNSLVTGDRGRIYYSNGNPYWTGNPSNEFLVIEKTDLNDLDPDGGIIFSNKGSDNIQEVAMTIRGSGNVGIGTTAPVNKLQVANGDVRVGEINPNGTGTLPGFGRILYFSGGPAPAGYNSDNSDLIWLARYNAAPDNSELRLNLSDNCNDGGDAFVIQSGGAGCSVNTVWFRFDIAGNAYKPGGGSWTALSDIRLKRNIKPFNLGLEIIEQINPVTYEYNGEAHTPNDGTQYVGVIAQELQKVAPFMVKPYLNEYLSVDPSAFTYILINSIKELKAENNVLKNAIKELKAENDELKAKMNKKDAEIEALNNEINKIKALMGIKAEQYPEVNK